MNSMNKKTERFFTQKKMEELWELPRLVFTATGSVNSGLTFGNSKTLELLSLSSRL